MKTSALFTVLTIFACINLHAQIPIDALINAEKKFATISSQQSSRFAFLANLDSNCVGFIDGSLVNLFNYWKGTPENSSKITWQPEYAVIAASGDIGFTTGPWELRPTSLQDPPTARGHYTTVWKKNSRGIWKAVCDIGITYKEAYPPLFNLKSSTLKRTNTAKMDSAKAMAIETNFINAFEESNAQAYQPYITEETWLNLNNLRPDRKAETSMLLAKIPADTKFKPSGSFLSLAKDLLCVYGTATTGNETKGYQRIWAFQGNQWKLLMQVL